MCSKCISGMVTGRLVRMITVRTLGSYDTHSLMSRVQTIDSTLEWTEDL